MGLGMLPCVASQLLVCIKHFPDHDASMNVGHHKSRFFLVRASMLLFHTDLWFWPN